MGSSGDVGPPVAAKFTLIFVAYVAYVLFRRLPLVLLPQVQKEIPLTREDIEHLTCFCNGYD
ncbi:unnamed protein product [Cylicocyclus nassatus]|uniref:Uncharacterized protein n=1 Tax=Cylicocyclus nassatus TaxID=53992 RepID=A0AA36H034_CYLNA|nr:unnamed protein product [Cylicocyclus nassatus]